MSKKQQLIHEMLQEDQEPFHLNNYISEKRCQLKKTKPNLTQLKKLNPMVSSSFQASNFTCKNSCLFALTTNSPDPTKSPIPFFDLHSPANRNTTPNAIFLHIPAKTASLLLEAALRIHKQSSSKPRQAQGFGLLGSLFKRLSLRNKKGKLDITTTIQREEKEIKEELGNGNLSDFFNGRLEDVNSDLNYDKQFCESPFHFVLLRSSPIADGCRTPMFSPTATSPSRRNIMDIEDTVGSQLKFQVQAEEDEEGRVKEEEDKEQCSPVSVLDPPFEEDDDGCENQMEDDGFDLECSYALVQRAKKQLLKKLRRFEKLAGLDPVELEKRMLDQDQEFENNDLSGESDISGSEEEVEFRKENLNLSNGEKNTDAFIMEELDRSSFHQLKKIPIDMNRLVSNVFDEEERDNYANGEVMAKRVCKRVESWKDVESNTIDMMVGHDFTREHEEWKRFQEQVEEAAFQIELVILGLLIEEFTEELVV